MSPSLSFVCCVESGWLEAQAVRLVESIRRHGGRYANAPIFAVTPRLGPPLAPATRATFDRLGITHLTSRRIDRHEWFKFLNKPKAIGIVEEHATTDALCWVDSDLLFLSEPTALAMDDVDFVAVCSDKEMGTSGPDDPYEPLWRALCGAVDLSIEQLPWVMTELERARIRMYWNGGFFAYRRESGFADHYRAISERLLEARLSTRAPGFSIGINEMIAIGFAVTKLGLSYRALPIPYNYPVASVTPKEWYSDRALAEVKVLHYHDAMWPPLWPTFIERLRRVHPEVADWVEPLGPMTNLAPLPYRVVNRGLKEIRDRREASYRKACEVVP